MPRGALHARAAGPQDGARAAAADPFFYDGQATCREMWARMQLHMLGLDAGARPPLMPPAPGTCAPMGGGAPAPGGVGYRVVLNMGDQWTDGPMQVGTGSTPSSYYGWRHGAHALCVKAPHRLLGAPPPPAQEAPGT